MARILVIDDSPLFRLVLREILTKSGNEVFEAGTVAEGMRIFREISPDLVFKDLIMEDSNPLEVIKDLIRYSPTAKIVICSTEGQKNLIYQAIRAGAMDFLIKPFSTSEVTMTVERLLAK